MNKELHDQIYHELNLRETEDLLEIWHANDHDEWSDMAFEIIQEILTKRLGEIPPKEETVVEELEEEDSKIENNSLPDWEAKLLDDDNQPEFYDPLEVLELRDNINKTATAVIVIYGLTNVMGFPYYTFLINSYFRVDAEYSFWVNVMAFILACLTAAVVIAITYYPLKALTHILRILMEMEYNSRNP